MKNKVVFIGLIALTTALSASEILDIEQELFDAIGCDIDKLQRSIIDGASVNVRDRVGYTPLFFAAALKEKDMAIKFVTELLHAGADVNIKNRFNQTALLETIHPEVVRLLLEAGAEIPETLNEPDGAFLNSVIKEMKEEEKVRSGLYAFSHCHGITRSPRGKCANPMVLAQLNKMLGLH